MDRALGAGTPRGRLLGTGLPLVLSSATLVVVPVVARQYLDDAGYAGWALLLTVVTAAGLFDLGAAYTVQSLGFGRRATPRQYVLALALATGGALSVTGLALLAAPWVSTTAAGEGLGPHPTLILLLTGLAAATRSAVLVVMARLQISLRFRLRACVAAVHAVAQVVGCWVSLAQGLGVWSLAVGILAGSLLALLAAHVGLALTPERVPPADGHIALGRFAGYRTASTLLAVTGSQADRWVLALVASPAFLADYDLALRFAQLPLGVAAALFAGLTSEAASTRGEDARRRLVRVATRRVGVVLAVLTLGDVLLVVGLALAGALPLDATTVGLLALAIVWSGANGLTAPTTFASIGTGHPQRELYYAAPALACTLLGWGVAVGLRQPWLVPLSTGVSVTAWSLWFVAYGTRRAGYAG
ncbi:oligosaccharide flippase family protein [Arthrobacter sp. NEB 688]|uniref:lipopolysaccharide biosynthesis protein n=1 Tax=Arthrobacter sp. NEB 688 TaxID=904039 RepID=UPI0015668696|nr:oligosaccharide flippase family protein [Arthrobacter sp. NEB 688]QKE85503.1 oligosaccharide flippase family protein [Arthrobacter sp. NEB 688]